MGLIIILGLIAAFCTTVSFIPQALKTIRTKETKDLSLTMYSVLTTGIFFWLVYGILLHNIPIILANSVTIVFTLTILIQIIRYK